MTNYLLACEIGPIVDFISKSRKTTDLWGGSFLFSHIMRKAANEIKINGGEIFIPFLPENFYETNDSGSIPDQIFAIVSEGKRPQIKAVLTTILPSVLEEICRKIYVEKGIETDFDPGQLTDYFYLFHIWHVIKGEKPSYDEYIVAEKKLKARMLVHKFNQLPQGNSVPKWNKCSLCGDREGIYHRHEEAGKDEPANRENICRVCLLKRFLMTYIEKTSQGYKPQKYQSTSDIALSPVKIFLEEKNNWKEIKEQIDDFKENRNETDDNTDGRYFYDPEFQKKLSNVKEDLKTQFAESSEIKWFSRPFYSIVYMDGDNMGKFMSNVAERYPKEFSNVLNNISESIFDFSEGVRTIVEGHHGQLIYAGGDDVIFMIHPEYLLQCICRLVESYRGKLTSKASEASLEQGLTKLLTISSGAVICPHKFPLSKAISLSLEMLHDHAKKFRNDKNGIGICLIKGHTESLRFTIPNEFLGALIELRTALPSSAISMTAPHRLAEVKEFLEVIEDGGERRKYVETIIEKTRDGSRRPKTDTFLDKLMTIDSSGETSQAKTALTANTLLFLRFMSEDR